MLYFCILSILRILYVYYNTLSVYLYFLTIFGYMFSIIIILSSLVFLNILSVFFVCYSGIVDYCWYF